MQGITDYQSLKRNILFEYLEKYAGVPSRQVAKILHRDNPANFATIEEARYMVRRYRGRAGNRNRKEVKIKKYYEEI